MTKGDIWSQMEAPPILEWLANNHKSHEELLATYVLAEPFYLITDLRFISWSIQEFSRWICRDTYRNISSGRIAGGQSGAILLLLALVLMAKNNAVPLNIQVPDNHTVYEHGGRNDAMLLKLAGKHIKDSLKQEARVEPEIPSHVTTISRFHSWKPKSRLQRWPDEKIEPIDRFSDTIVTTLPIREEPPDDSQISFPSCKPILM
jgi:hypothetical protein